MRHRLPTRVAAVAGIAVVACSVVVGIGIAAPADPGASSGSPVPARLTGLDRIRTDLPLVRSGEAAPTAGRAAAPSAVGMSSGSPSRAVAPAGTPTAPAAAPATVPAPAGSGPATEGLVPGTPCTPTARACVDLGTGRAWLLDGEKIVRGPVSSRHGDVDEPTPLGTFTVQWKAEQYTSREFGTPMPFSVFFAPGGIAFHEGRLDTPSAGCVKLGHEDAVAWFGHLQVGDEVQIH